MLIHPQIDPVALRIGPLAVHWYGLCYLVAFGSYMWLAFRRLKHQPFASSTASPAGAWSRRDVEDMLFLGVLGVVIGGRLGYCLFYKPGYYFANPLKFFAVWEGGMSFHGGMLGVFVAMVWFAHSRGRRWLEVMDFAAPCVPLGLAMGRVGNFINGELWGRVADPSLPGAWCSRAPDRCRAIRRSSTRCCWKACCCLSCCGSTRAVPGRRATVAGSARSAACSCSATASCASSPSTSVSPTRFWDCCRSACRWGSGCVYR